MIDWATLEFARHWPAGLVAVAAVGLGMLWLLRRKSVFPDLGLLAATRRHGGWLDRLVPAAGLVLMAALVVVLMGPSVVRVETVAQNARDFVILVDTSRSMRHDSDALRAESELNFTRRVGAFSEAVDDPDTLPFVGRFELARESLFRFLADRRPGDRVALVYFNDEPHPVSALTSNIGFVTDQLETMDDYVNWGTDIASAMESSLNLLARYPGDNRRTMILITDAETRYTEDLEQQLTRVANAGLSFYLLWITADTGDLATEDAASFLDFARSLGSVITIKTPDARNVRDALAAISRLEGYRYEDVRHRTIDLGAPLLEVTRILFLAWLLLTATLFHPALGRAAFEVPRR
ncbi:MAG: VWA domain-containing protein [Woeseiaceae bacterium]|nr:VWA domain-containing protein [Woeseiaceae bacterium]